MESFNLDPEPRLSEMIVETTTACNIRCIHCAVSNEGYINKTLRYEAFENIVPIMKAYKPLVKLNGHGETLAHKRFFEMLDAAVNAGCRVVFQTNATLLVPDVSKRLLSYAGPDGLISISISIDGVGETFNTVRRKAHWEDYVSNIKTFRDLRSASNNPYPSLHFQFTTMLLNVHTLPATVAMVKELGGAGMTVGDLLEYPTAAGQSVTRDLEYARPFYEEAKRLAETLDVNFVPFPSLAEEMESAPYDPEKPLPAPRREYATPVILWETKSPGARPVPIPQLASLLPVAGVVECAGDIPTAAPPVEAQSPAIREESETSAAPPVPVGPQRPGMMRVKDCTDPWNFAFVQADGDIRPCCWIDDTMGNVNTESFESIWNSQKYQDLRKSVASANPRSECWGCQARGWKWVPEPLAAAVFAVE